MSGVIAFLSLRFRRRIFPNVDFYSHRSHQLFIPPFAGLSGKRGGGKDVPRSFSPTHEPNREFPTMLSLSASSSFFDPIPRKIVNAAVSIFNAYSTHISSGNIEREERKEKKDLLDHFSYE